MTREATFGSDAIQRQFSELAELLENELTVYLIGGGALTLDDLKNLPISVGDNQTVKLAALTVWYFLLGVALR